MWAVLRKGGKVASLADGLKSIFGPPGGGRRGPGSAGKTRALPVACGQQRIFRDWRALLNRKDVLIVDTETTGVDDQAEVIEVCALDTTGMERFSALALPQGRISRRNAAIHGLTLSALREEGARHWPEVHPSLADLLRATSAVLAWNAEFDRRMLAQTSARYGLPAPLPRARWRDLLADYRQYRPAGPHGLQHAIVRERAASTEIPHRAMNDCRMVLAVMRAVVSECTKKRETGGPTG